MQYFIMYLLGEFHDIGIMYAGALRPCIIFHKMISADVLSLEYIVSDGSSRRWNDYFTNIFLGTFLCRQESTAKKLSTDTALTNQL